MDQLTLPAPAKLNLFLHITGRRADGYHELETLFQFLTLADELRFTCTDHGSVTIESNAEVSIALQDNLIYRAAEKLLPLRANPSLGVTIALHKQLPMGGGVGGGSSDAATTLLALNHLWQLGLSPEQLAEIGLTLGADVPVFIHGQATFARGVGEQFAPAAPTEAWYLVVHPQVHVSTAEIFQHPELPRATPKLLDPARHCSELAWIEQHNDCEKLVRSLYPQVASALDWLLKYAPSRLTGTGACVFAVFSTQQQAEQALRELPEQYRGFVAQGVNHSPAHQALAQALPSHPC
ncbi:MAG: 4-(cytidine 5'-diphospho)-2-C-methyl-D-erythritol kinase [Aliidiomarina sp.]|uniref:4-(cytidine 5'-diphospho)-2-C-methyl-D-erythritol kinase n=1 Tax=Aliidiomarina sp. TaxID=1872439 RepID=UPI0025B7EFAF|nr:4-(cytidine 5'-diphospho)-2-C-methyl-D-erythritol kinase [Aliidiomarina sp.]MCH8502096.1 4-(cytidine 5'-diphospho)-2-C-methyl-D-erythritol kinase [Aliidiomarina sp.]